MLATIIVSVRAPLRSGPASLPTSRTLSRGLVIASAAAVPPPPVNSESSRVRCELARLAANPSGAATTRQSAATVPTPIAFLATARPGGRATRYVWTITAIQASPPTMQPTVVATSTLADSAVSMSCARPEESTSAASPPSTSRNTPRMSAPVRVRLRIR